MAGFDRRDGLLYVVQNGGIVTLYKPGEGILTTIDLAQPGKGPNRCIETPLSGTSPKGQRVYAIAHPELQELFDGMASNPTAFVNATAVVPPDYTRNGTWKNARTLVTGPALRTEKRAYVIGLAQDRDQLIAVRAQEVSPDIAEVRRDAAGAEGRAQQLAADARGFSGPHAGIARGDGLLQHH